MKSSGKYCRIRGFASGGADFLRRRKVEGTDRKNRRIGQEKSCKHVKTSSGRDPSLRGPVGQRLQDILQPFLKEDPSVASTLLPLEIRRDYPRFLSKLCALG